MSQLFTSIRGGTKYKALKTLHCLAGVYTANGWHYKLHCAHHLNAKRHRVYKVQMFAIW